LAYFANSFNQPNGKQDTEISSSGEDRSQQRQQGRPEYTHQHQQLAADLLGKYSANDLRCGVAVEERSECESLSFCIPVEDSVRLKHSAHQQLDIRQHSA